MKLTKKLIGDHLFIGKEWVSNGHWIMRKRLLPVAGIHDEATANAFYKVIDSQELDESRIESVMKYAKRVLLKGVGFEALEFVMSSPFGNRGSDFRLYESDDGSANGFTGDVRLFNRDYIDAFGCPRLFSLNDGEDADLVPFFSFSGMISVSVDSPGGGQHRDTVTREDLKGKPDAFVEAHYQEFVRLVIMPLRKDALEGKYVPNFLRPRKSLTPDEK